MMINLTIQPADRTIAPIDPVIPVVDIVVEISDNGLRPQDREHDYGFYDIGQDEYI